MNENEEQELLAQAVAGDQDAREQCAADLGGYVTFHVELLYGSDPTKHRSKLMRCLAPEELAQEVWYTLCEQDWPLRANEGQPLAAVIRTWLLATARNKFLNVLRKAQKTPMESVDTVVWEGVVREGVARATRSVVTKAADNERHRTVRAWIDAQNTETRDMLRARSLEESYETIGRRHWMSADAVRKRLSRIYAELRSSTNLDDFVFDPGLRWQQHKADDEPRAGEASE